MVSYHLREMKRKRWPKITAGSQAAPYSPHRNPHRALEINSLADNFEKVTKVSSKKKKKRGKKSPLGGGGGTQLFLKSTNHNNPSGGQAESGSDSPVSHNPFASDLCCQSPEWGDGCAAVSSGQVLLTNQPQNRWDKPLWVFKCIVRREFLANATV